MEKHCDRPIVVVGLGRSGSSIFHRIFSYHPSVAWLSNLSDRAGSGIKYNKWLMHGIDLPFLGKMLHKKYESEECYQFWERYCKGFRTPCRDLVLADLSDRSKNGIKKVIPQVLTRERNRLLLKITGWPRIGYLNGIFEDALFIHVKRDPAAVANSLMNVDWWWGWRGPQNWRWGELSGKYQDLWEKYDRSFVALAGIECLIYRDAIESSKLQLRDNNFYEVEYEDLCENPIDIYRSVVDFCDLKWSEKFETVIRSQAFRNTNHKWRQDLTDEQQQILVEILSS